MTTTALPDFETAIRNASFSMEFRRQCQAELEKLRGRANELGEDIRKASNELRATRRMIDSMEVIAGERRESEPSDRARAVTDMAEQILADESPREIYFKDLANEIRMRNSDLLPALDKSAFDTLNRLLNEDPDQRFKRPTRRGHYALARDYPEHVNVGARMPAAAKSEPVRALARYLGGDEEAGDDPFGVSSADSPARISLSSYLRPNAALLRQIVSSESVDEDLRNRAAELLQRMTEPEAATVA